MFLKTRSEISFSVCVLVHTMLCCSVLGNILLYVAIINVVFFIILLNLFGTQLECIWTPAIKEAIPIESVIFL
ncbi:hypothetical protein AADW59_00380 [Candidatus Hodgkinia cicadicola]